MSSNEVEFEWYQIVSGTELEQGDFLVDFPILLQPLDMPTDVEQLKNTSISPNIEIYNVVVMTQSCDFQKLVDTDLVTLCPRSDYSDLYNKGDWKPLREGRRVNAHLLNKSIIEGHEFDYQIVNLSRVLAVPYGYAKKFALDQGERVRLLSPYREHLAQAFARRFMRVGLPIDLPTEYPY